ncbi:MAG: hypothetical protein IKR70_04705 [Lachnospiraceae bacterium]|nr:hypothetical protein [Lachnospiraceae bacterium]
MKYRAALASFDGQYVDQHFGHAKKYYIYEFDDQTDTYEFVERRFVDVFCECGNSSSDAFSDVFEKLYDVGAIIISKIGAGAAGIVESKGYVIYESYSRAEDVLNSINKNRLYEADKWREISKN